MPEGKEALPALAMELPRNRGGRPKTYHREILPADLAKNANQSRVAHALAVGHALKRLFDLSDEELVPLLGVSPATWYRWLRGQSQPPRPRSRRIDALWREVREAVPVLTRPEQVALWRWLAVSRPGVLDGRPPRAVLGSDLPTVLSLLRQETPWRRTAFRLH